MNQYEFNKLLEKYLAGQCSEQEEQLVLDWYKQTIDTTHITLLSDEKEGIKQSIWRKIKTNTLIEEENPRLKIWRYFAVAASILLVLGIGWAFWDKIVPQNETIIVAAPSVDKTNKEVKNTSEKSQDISLEDGSTVALKPNSTLSYPEHFDNQNRTVYLTGEALFKIKRNPNKPFLVHAGNLVTEVLGTSFIIKSNVNTKLTEVRVLSGRVSVYEETTQNNKNRKGEILTPNHKVVYNNESKQLIPSIVEEPIVVNTMKTLVVDLNFEEDTPLPKVLAVLKKRYDLDFVVANEALNNCEFTGDLNDMPMFKQLDFVCHSINADYEIRGTNIFINGRGCK
jgi:transmembrane sensor